MGARRFLTNILIKGDKQFDYRSSELMPSAALSVGPYLLKGLKHLGLVVRKPLLDINKQSTQAVSPGLGTC